MEMNGTQVDRIISSHAAHGESAFWDSFRRRAVFCDCDGTQLWTYRKDENLWIAVWGGGCILKADPRSGKILKKFSVPSRCPSSCVFGGDGMKDLYITTSRQWIKKDTVVPEGDCSGDMFVIRDAVRQSY